MHTRSCVRVCRCTAPRHDNAHVVWISPVRLQYIRVCARLYECVCVCVCVCVCELCCILAFLLSAWLVRGAVCGGPLKCHHAHPHPPFCFDRNSSSVFSAGRTRQTVGRCVRVDTRFSLHFIPARLTPWAGGTPLQRIFGPQ